VTSDLAVSGPRTGVVTFLDILGWRGIYQRQPDPLGDLARLIEALRDLGDEGTTDIKSISDTIAVFTPVTEGEVQGAIERHGQLCARAVCDSIVNHIPVRGATSFGEFQLHHDMFVGPAVDEAAGWYEQGDWIGVHLTPSADFRFGTQGSQYWVRYEAPLKVGRLETACVWWGPTWDADAGDAEALRTHFIQMGPLTPDISAKFINTLSFYDHLTKQG
jgi:hypothetical protein